ncbi:MAG: hypothetical protein D6743_08995 [Calditrichaeota bacterium]|nr:MAG: hypothetical protein D6743_08995 [Calditrichota bacterium]
MTISGSDGHAAHLNLQLQAIDPSAQSRNGLQRLASQRPDEAEGSSGAAAKAAHRASTNRVAGSEEAREGRSARLGDEERNEPLNHSEALERENEGVLLFNQNGEITSTTPNPSVLDLFA